MAHWNGERIVWRPDLSWPGYPNWLLVDCGCSGGTEWSTLPPQGCDVCYGNGVLAKHLPSGLVSLYPGGPIRYREPVTKESTC